MYKSYHYCPSCGKKIANINIRVPIEDRKEENNDNNK